MSLDHEGIYYLFNRGVLLNNKFRCISPHNVFVYMYLCLQSNHLGRPVVHLAVFCVALHFVCFFNFVPHTRVSYLLYVKCFQVPLTIITTKVYYWFVLLLLFEITPPACFNYSIQKSSTKKNYFAPTGLKFATTGFRPHLSSKWVTCRVTKSTKLFSVSLL